MGSVVGTRRPVQERPCSQLAQHFDWARRRTDARRGRRAWLVDVAVRGSSDWAAQELWISVSVRSAERCLPITPYLGLGISGSSTPNPPSGSALFRARR